MRYIPYDYQRAAGQWIVNHPRCALFLGMGLGKTVITLTAIRRLMDDCDITRTLVVAPKKVAETTWSEEAVKWDHLGDLRVVRVMGTEKKRNLALASQADVYVISRSNRFKAMRMAVGGMDRVIGLTGTPAPNGLIDLWAQMYCIDQGERLGKSVTRYRETYFETHRWNNIVVRCTVKKGCDDIIRRKIADICLSMQAKDYLQLPDLLVHTVRVALSDAVMEKYNRFEREKVMEFQAAGHDGEPAHVLANSAAGLMNKLSQFANGAVYDDDRSAHEVHDEKLDRLAELVEAAGGESVLVFYQYRHDVSRITKKLKGYKVVAYEGEADLRAWNAGQIDVMLAHPAITAFGLNMQQGGHYIVWFGLGWNLELYQQANARLHRQGQQHPVTVYRLVCAGTVDERAEKALEGKKGVQQALLDSLDYLMRKHGGHGNGKE